MSVFIAVAFLCMGETCVFWKADETFETELQCEVAARMFILDAQKQGVEKIHATCMPVILPPQT